MITLDSYRKELSAILERELGGRNIQEVYLSDGGYVTFVSMTTEEDKQNLEPYVGNPNEEFKFDEIFREFFGEEMLFTIPTFTIFRIQFGIDKVKPMFEAEGLDWNREIAAVIINSSLILDCGNPTDGLYADTDEDMVESGVIDQVETMAKYCRICDDINQFLQ